MKKESGISLYKLCRMGRESIKNALRLHFDAILLFRNESYPSAFQLSVLSLEEFAKAKWIEDYVWTSETNDGYPDEDFEQSWLKSLFSHPEKQWAFLAREVFDHSPAFAEFVQKRGLEEKKQQSVYVGLSRSRKRVDTNSRVSTPQRIKKKDAEQIISLINATFVEICSRLDDDDYDDWYFCIDGMDEAFDRSIHLRLLDWRRRSGLRSRRWSKVWFSRQPK